MSINEYRLAVVSQWRENQRLFLLKCRILANKMLKNPAKLARLTAYIFCFFVWRGRRKVNQSWKQCPRRPPFPPSIVQKHQKSTKVKLSFYFLKAMKCSNNKCDNYVIGLCQTCTTCMIYLIYYVLYCESFLECIHGLFSILMQIQQSNTELLLSDMNRFQLPQSFASLTSSFLTDFSF